MSSHPAQEPATAQARNKRVTRLRAFAVAPLVVLLGLWLYLFYLEGAFKGGPDGVAFGADTAMYLAGAEVMSHGGNPYDHHLLYRTERAMLARQGLEITDNQPIVRVGNPPLFIWALEPFTRLPFQPVALGMILIVYGASLAGLLGSLQYVGWKRWLFPSLVFMAMPQVVLGAFYGNNLGLVFGAVGCGLALLRRHPFAAGMLLSLAWIKPPVALPIVLLVVAFHTPARHKFIAGFSLATAAGLILTMVLTGWRSLVFWVGGMLGYSEDINLEPDIASLAGLYVRWAPYQLRTALGAALILLALVLTFLTWKRVRHRPGTSLLKVGWLWMVWLLVTPYAHFSDEMFLTVPLVALLGPMGNRLPRRIPTAVLYLMFGSLVLFSWYPMDVQLLCLPLLAVAGCLVIAAKRSQLTLVEASAGFRSGSGSRLD